MIIKEKKGNLNSFETNNRIVDYLLLEWYETNKRILHKKTVMGREVMLKFLDQNQQLTEGDILYEDAEYIIAVSVIECEVIIIKPSSMAEMANTCYEIGNKHLPLFYEKEELMVPFDEPLFKLLKAGGYAVETGMRKLVSPLKTSVAPHVSSDSLFSRIIKLTSSN